MIADAHCFHIFANFYNVPGDLVPQNQRLLHDPRHLRPISIRHMHI